MSAQGDRISLSIPVSAKYIAAARLLTAGLAARANLSVEAVEDLKIAVSEACTNVTEHAFASEAEARNKTIDLTFHVANGELTVAVEDEGCGFDPKHLPDMNNKPVVNDTGIGVYLIREMMDEVKIESAPGSGTKIVMTKRCAR